MKINIHLVSHPSVQSLCSLIDNQKPVWPVKHKELSKLGLFMTYEILRSWTKSYTVTIKQKKYKKEITITDPKESYIIIFSSLKDLSFLRDISEIIPRSRLQLISTKEIEEDKDFTCLLPKIDLNTKIIIAASKLKSQYIARIMENLVLQSMQIEQIRLMCIACETNELIKLNQKHKEVKIFTSKITDS